MSREHWTLIKNKKNFNIQIFRQGLKLLVFSLSLSCILGVLIFYVYLNEPERNYYATSGIAPPVQLKSLSAPNRLSTALLEPDPPTVDEQRVIPQ